VLLRRLFLALTMAAVLLFYFALRAKALSPAIVEARLQALQAGIRPDFLCDRITAVLSLVRSEPRRAESALEDMADLFRVLMADNRQLTPLVDEVALCRQYLDLEKLRLGDRLCIDWHVDNMPRDALVPPLVLQPLLENAVHHGIEPSSARGVIAINIFLRRGEVHDSAQPVPVRQPAPERQQDGACQHPRTAGIAFRCRSGAGEQSEPGDIRSAYPHAVSDSFGRQERVWLMPR
jgi:two-component system sensor histidine kinase AlgZ